MLNKFQLDVIAYFEATAGHFLTHIKEKHNSEFIIIDNIVPELFTYLGAMIKRDLALHTEHSEGFNHLSDMLIEIHLTPNEEFVRELLKTALLPIRYEAL